MPRSGLGGAALAVILLSAQLVRVEGQNRERKDVIDMEFCGNDDCYKILNVSSDATRGEIKKGYHKLSLQHHPDKVGHKSDEEQAEAHKIFVQVAAAYEVLSDEKSRRSYDMWVRGGRKRRPGIDDDFDGPIPDYYRDDHVRGDVKDTPAAFAAVIVTLLISIGVPLWMSVQVKMKKRKAERGFISKILGKDEAKRSSAPSEPVISRKERRGETDRPAKDTQELGFADISAVSTMARGDGEGGEGAGGASRSITKVEGPWSPEEDAELTKWTAKLPGGTVDRWLRIAELVGTRTADQCIKRAAELKGKAAVLPGAKKSAPPAEPAKVKAAAAAAGAGGEMGKGKGAAAGGASEAVKGKGADAGGGASVRQERKEMKQGGNPLLKVPVQEFAKMVKEQQAAKAVEGVGKPVGDKGWTAEEQTLLENAMRAVDKSAEDRWEQIAERVPGRSKKEVLQRVKDLKEMLKKKPE